MARYRKKPVVIEAMRFNRDTMNRCFNFVTCNRYADFDEDGDPILRIQTLEGVMTAKPGDYIVKGVRGEFYPCRSDIFEATYEQVDD